MPLNYQSNLTQDISKETSELFSPNLPDLLLLPPLTMASLSATHHPHHHLHKSSNILIHEAAKHARCCPRKPTVVLACQRGRGGTTSGRTTTKGRKELKQEKQLLTEMLMDSVDKFGKGLKESLSPKQKGDWKDVVLMSLSFAVYVYMSQQLVCAYCVWQSMMKQPW